ncbi:hypothetical protein RB195_020719 [Necator americanus]|uniref:Uncharacterized protein n=1 Tax=Necator americanus TaxID=51031 RepID=A0ABR1CMX6_NECAM
MCLVVDEELYGQRARGEWLLVMELVPATSAAAAAADCSFCGRSSFSCAKLPRRGRDLSIVRDHSSSFSHLKLRKGFCQLLIRCDEFRETESTVPWELLLLLVDIPAISIYHITINRWLMIRCPDRLRCALSSRQTAYVDDDDDVDLLWRTD